jgi:hypothetical protein
MVELRLETKYEHQRHQRAALVFRACSKINNLKAGTIAFE